MDEIEVGEYIRTDDGIIAKVNNIDELRIDIPTDRAVYRIWVDDYYGNHKEDRFIKSHSKNIIDLIEIGDIVAVKDTIDNYTDTFIEEISNDFGLKAIQLGVEIGHNILISILTREQYKQNCYKEGVD